MDKVKSLLRAQINAGFAPIQSALAQEPQDPAATHLSPEAAPSPFLMPPGSEQQREQGACASHLEAVQDTCPAGATASLTELLDALHAFAHSPAYRLAPKAVQTLTQALEQQVRLALREAYPSS